MKSNCLLMLALAVTAIPAAQRRVLGGERPCLRRVVLKRLLIGRQVSILR